MHGSDPGFLQSIGTFLGFYYLFIALMNSVAALYLWGRKGRPGQAIFLLVAFVVPFLILSPFALSGQPAGLPNWFTDAVNAAANAVLYTALTTGALVVLYLFRGFFVRTDVAWIGLNLALLLMGLSMVNQNFALIVTKPDNVPIVGLVFLLGFFTWLATAKAVENDNRIAQGLGPAEKDDNEKVLVWPDLVYTELICMVALTAFLLVRAIGLPAPLEEPASSIKTPNPSKAPWYFLGLQEMLVYYDPWMAGVVLPSLIVFGLMAIPYIDFNKTGNGYYTIDQRKFAYLTFQFGFLVLWVTLIVMGTFLPGPNLNSFGPYEVWDAHKVEALNNRDLSEFFWIDMPDLLNLGWSRPKAPEGSSDLTKVGYAIFRELPGIVLVIGYLAILPPMLVVVSKFFRDLFIRMGFIRYMVLANLLLMMLLLPLKMLGRWTVNLKYVISMPEYLLNF